MNHGMRLGLVTALVTAGLALGGVAPARSVPPPTAQLDGVVASAYDAALGFGVAGLVAQVLVEAGQAVEAGTALAHLEDTEAAAAAALARLTAENDVRVRQAEQRLQTARRDEKRPELAEAAELELTRARLQHAQAQLQRDIAESRLRQHTLAASVEGVIEQVLVSPGAYVRPGQPVVRLVQPQRLLVLAQAPSDVATNLREGQRVMVAARGGEGTAAGRIVHVAGVIDPETDSRAVRIALDDGAKLLPGAHVTIEAQPPVETTDPADDDAATS